MPPSRCLRSARRRSSRTPHIPQNLCSGRFSVPQNVHCIWTHDSLSRVRHTPTAAHILVIRMTPRLNTLQAFYHLNPLTQGEWKFEYLNFEQLTGLKLPYEFRVRHLITESAGR